MREVGVEGNFIDRKDWRHPTYRYPPVSMAASPRGHTKTLASLALGWFRSSARSQAVLSLVLPLVVCRRSWITSYIVAKD